MVALKGAPRAAVSSFGVRLSCLHRRCCVAKAGDLGCTTSHLGHVQAFCLCILLPASSQQRETWSLLVAVSGEGCSQTSSLGLHEHCVQRSWPWGNHLTSQCLHLRTANIYFLYFSSFPSQQARAPCITPWSGPGTRTHGLSPAGLQGVSPGYLNYLLFPSPHPSSRCPPACWGGDVSSSHA